MLHGLQINGTEFRVFEQGKGSPILFVHGFPLDHSMWKHQLNYWSERYRVIAPDLRGFGGSRAEDTESISMETYAEDLVEILNALEIAEPVIYCGLSMGGYIGWQFLMQSKSRLAALIQCDTKSAADPIEIARGRQLMAQQVMSSGVEEPAQTMISKLFCQRTFDRQPELVNETLCIMLQTDRRSVAAAQRGMSQRADMSNTLSSIDLPTLAICGAEDVITPPDEMRAMANQIEDSTFCLIPDAGHMAPLENPDAFHSAVDRFLSRL